MCDNANPCIISGHNISDFIDSQPNYYEGNSTTGAVGSSLSGVICQEVTVGKRYTIIVVYNDYHNMHAQH